LEANNLGAPKLQHDGNGTGTGTGTRVQNTRTTSTSTTHPYIKKPIPEPACRASLISHLPTSNFNYSARTEGAAMYLQNIGLCFFLSHTVHDKKRYLTQRRPPAHKQ